jgi:hypothetical protein
MRRSAPSASTAEMNPRRSWYTSLVPLVVPVR